MTGTFCAKHPKGLSGKRCLSPFVNNMARMKRRLSMVVVFLDLFQGNGRLVAQFANNAFRFLVGPEGLDDQIGEVHEPGAGNAPIVYRACQGETVKTASSFAKTPDRRFR